MYCIKCGVKLADTEQVCPLCQTIVFHPDITRVDTTPLFPPQQEPIPQLRTQSINVILTAIFLLPLLITLLCDWQITQSITWSGYVAAALLFSYTVVILPMWFRKPNPVIFVPCDFAAAALFLMFINYAVEGNWFWTLALPMTGGLGLIVTAVVVLLKYLRKGILYILGGAFIALGLLMTVLEILIHVTFDPELLVVWSFYPLIAFVLLGGTLIFLAVCRPARQTMERKFFI